MERCQTGLSEAAGCYRLRHRHGASAFYVGSTDDCLTKYHSGNESRKLPVYKEKDIAKKIKALSQKYGLAVDVDKRIDELSVGEQQRVEILKALYRNAKLLVLDEPTAVLTPQETEVLFSVLRSLKEDGHSIILISHRLAEIMEITDKITVLRSGKELTRLQPQNVRKRFCPSL